MSENELENLTIDERNTINEHNITLTNGIFEVTLEEIHPMFFKHIAGKNGNKKSDLENKTNCKLTIPKRGCDRSKRVVVTSWSVHDLLACKTQLMNMTGQLKKIMPPTHFIAIMLSHNETFLENYERFMSHVRETCSQEMNFHEKLFQKPLKHHFSVLVSLRCCDAEVAESVEFSHKLFEQIKDKYGDQLENLRVSLKGLSTFSEDPSHVDVVYAKISEDSNCEGGELLQSISNEMAVKWMTEHSILDKKFCYNEMFKVNLHVTVLNTSFLFKHMKGKPEPFDARRIFELYGDYDFGEVVLKNINFLAMKAPMKGEEGVGGDSYTNVLTFPLFQ